MASVKASSLGLVAAEGVVVPFTADDSSRRAIENVVALLYGVADDQVEAYAKISLAKRAKEEGLFVPKLHTFISNRVTLYEGSASRAFQAVNQTIHKTMDTIYQQHRGSIFFNSKELPSRSFIEIPDYHSACVVATLTGTPLHKLKAGPRILEGERVQLNKEPLNKYRDALKNFVNCP